MDTKLTLKLDADIIEQAKTYAKQKNTSLSKLIESYLGLLIDPKETQDVTPLVIYPKTLTIKKTTRNTY